MIATQVPFGIEGWLGSAYQIVGQPERSVEWCRAQLARGRDTHTLTSDMPGARTATRRFGDEARAAATA